MLQAVVPPAHRRFLDSFEDMIVEGDYVFVHAGVRPGVALKKQRPGDLRWIREEFLGESGGGSAPVIPGMTVVHGHTTFEKVVELPGRIGLDTGAYCSGIRSEEHTSELQSLMRISYAVFCLKKKKKKHNPITTS